jgi:SAM-dependent methyltransferase
MSKQNLDQFTIRSFGDEWSRFDQQKLETKELEDLFLRYFEIFPWSALPAEASGFDLGCGSGRWAKLVAPRVGCLACIDASTESLSVARRTLKDATNVRFVHATAESAPIETGSQDFGYSLGVLHHVPDTESALRACVAMLKPGAPFLLYLYYRFDNRPLWFRGLWRASEVIRAVVSRLPSRPKALVTDVLALLLYLPLARLSRFGEWLRLEMKNMPLYTYRNTSFYTMRTDCRDRFGTPLEQRFAQPEIVGMMERSGLSNIVFSEREPYWVAVGFKV